MSEEEHEMKVRTMREDWEGQVRETIERLEEYICRNNVNNTGRGGGAGGGAGGGIAAYRDDDNNKNDNNDNYNRWNANDVDNNNDIDDNVNRNIRA